MTHIRRGFTKALDARERDAARIIHLMAYIYHIEEQLRQKQSDPALRAAIRASHCAPRLRLINNYLFFGSRRGGELACVTYTLIENCKRHGLDLQGYLKQAMQLLVEHGAGRAAEFTPAAVARASRNTKAS